MNLRTCLLLAFASSAVAKFDFDFVKGTAADTDSTSDDTDFSFLPKWLVRLGPRPPVAAHHEQAACEPTYAPHYRTPGYRRRSRLPLWLQGAADQAKEATHRRQSNSNLPDNLKIS